MAAISTNYYGLLREGEIALGVETTTANFSNYTNVIRLAEGLPSSYYYITLERDRRFNNIDFPTEYFSDIEAALGITLVNGDLFVATPLQSGLTKEQRQTQKLNIAAATRQSDGNPRDTYDIAELPTRYSGNVLAENPNAGGLIMGRPWQKLNSGLYFRAYTGYFADNPNWFATATPTGTASTPSNFPSTAIPVTTSNQYLGYFRAPESGTFTFFINSDDASFLWVGPNATSGFTTSNALASNPGEHGPEEDSGTITLVQGYLYSFRAQAGNNGGPGIVSISFSSPTISKTTNFTNYVFHNPDTNGL